MDPTGAPAADGHWAVSALRISHNTLRRRHDVLVDRVHIGEGESWEHFVSHSFYELRLHSVAQGFRARASLLDLGRGIRVSDVVSGASTLTRSPRLVSANPSDDLLFLMQLSGHSRIEQDGRRLVLRAGHATFCDPSAPYTIQGVEPRQQQFVTMVPRREVLAPGTTAQALRLHDVDLSLTPLRVFRLLVEEVVSDPGDHGLTDLGGIASAAGDLLRGVATLVSSSSSSSGVASWSAEARLRVVRDFILTRLPDATLTMGQVAAANSMSVRSLSNLFAPNDSPAAFMRRERLRGARRDLLDPAAIGVPVAAVGARWGYPDPTTFGRAYRRTYAESPAQTRRRREGS